MVILIFIKRKIATLLQSGVSVLSQGSLEDGRDLVECAMLSLALIMVDPFFRYHTLHCVGL